MCVVGSYNMSECWCQCSCVINTELSAAVAVRSHSQCHVETVDVCLTRESFTSQQCQYAEPMSLTRVGHLTCSDDFFWFILAFLSLSQLSCHYLIYLLSNIVYQ